MKKLNVLAAAIAVVSLVACGGGGGGGSSDGGSGGSTVSLSGVAAKGLLSAAEVQAYDVGSDGTLKAIGTKKLTDADGAYVLTDLPKTTNTVVVTVTTTSATEMLDETLPLVNGKFVKSTTPLKVGTQIRSMVPSLSVNSEVHITPFTEMAVSAAQSTGKITSESMASARVIVTDSLGIDPFITKPVNADATMSVDQQTQMALLTAVAIDAKATPCTGDASGVSCAVKKLNDASAIDKDAATGKYKVKTTDSIKTKLTSLKTGVSSYTPAAGTYVGAAKTTMAAYVVPNTPPAVDPLQAIQSASLDNFLSSIRSGFNTAENTIKDRTDAAKKRIDALVFDSASDGVNTLTNALDNCSVSSSNVLTCVNSVVSSIGYAGGPNNYTLSYNSYDKAYSFSGKIVFASNGGSNTITFTNAKTRVADKIKVQDISLVATGSGLAANATSGSINFSTFVVKQFDTSGNGKYSQVDMSGLSLTANSATNIGSMTAPLTVSTSDGDSLSGKLNNLEVTKVASVSCTACAASKQAYADKLDVSLDVKSKEGNILSFSMVAVRDVKTFNPTLPSSANNVPNESVTINSTLADNVNAVMTYSQNKFNAAAVNVKVTSNGSWINMAANLDVDSQGSETINKDGVTITSSGAYSIQMAKDNSGNFQGKLYEGTKQIGVVTDGIVYVGTDKTSGRQVSLK